MVRVWLAIACMFGLLERRFLVLRGLPCCVVGMRKSLRIRGSSGEEDYSGAFWFPAFLRFALLSNWFGGKQNMKSKLPHISQMVYRCL